MTLNSFTITKYVHDYTNSPKIVVEEKFDAMDYAFEIPTNGWFCIYKKNGLTDEKKKIFVALYPPNTIVNVEFEYRKGEMIVKV